MKVELQHDQESGLIQISSTTPNKAYTPLAVNFYAKSGNSPQLREALLNPDEYEFTIVIKKAKP